MELTGVIVITIKRVEDAIHTKNMYQNTLDNTKVVALYPQGGEGAVSLRKAA